MLCVSSLVMFVLVAVIVFNVVVVAVVIVVTVVVFFLCSRSSIACVKSSPLYVRPIVLFFIFFIVIC